MRLTVRRLAVLALLAAGCGRNVEGELWIGAERFAPDECASGDPLGFFGIEMWEDSGRVAQFVGFDAGPAFIVFEPGGQEAFRLHPEDCNDFDGRLARETVRPIGPSRMKGYLSLHCPTPSGLVEGRLDFLRCGTPDDDEDDCPDDDDDWDDDDWDDDDWDDE